jgi:hypothetical protein
VNENPDGILGNLPRSRPGVRSEKRGGSAAAAKPASAGARPAAAKAPKARAPRQPRAARRHARPPKPPPEPSTSGDPLERAVHLAADAAETGIKVLTKVAGGVLRRLPRP